MTEVVQNTRIRLEIMKLVDEPFVSWKTITKRILHN